ncbi:MAG: group III truncated hemoglobin [Saprospiraceae bacterium]
MNDIKSRKDIETLVNSFYLKVRNNEIIGFIFDDVAHVDWEHHLPRMYDFWETTLFGKAVYKGNPIIKHILLSKKTPMDALHFDTWLALWKQTVDENFIGETANEAKQKAQNISALMLYKIQNANNSHYQN